MNVESRRRMQVASRVLLRFSNASDKPLAPFDLKELRELAESASETCMDFDDLACIVIKREMGREQLKSKAKTA
jgi:hypothetical protein